MTKQGYAPWTEQVDPTPLDKISTKQMQRTAQQLVKLYKEQEESYLLRPRLQVNAGDEGSDA